jgi:hypothetical protein
LVCGEESSHSIDSPPSDTHDSLVEDLIDNRSHGEMLLEATAIVLK